MRLGKFKEARLNDSAGKLLVIPVSYTHLDVYKRQRLYFEKVRLVFVHERLYIALVNVNM